MDEPGVLPTVLRQVGEKGDNIVFCLALNLVDTIDLESPPFPYCLCRFLGNDPELRLRITRMGFNFKPDAEFILGRPDRGHFRSAISRNHIFTSGSL